MAGTDAFRWRMHVLRNRRLNTARRGCILPMQNQEVTAMRIEWNPGVGALRLVRGQTLRLVEGAGSTICAREGKVWITEENRPRDIVLEPGECHRLSSGGVAVVEALGEASVTLSERTGS
jgi:hypothetical protein